MMGEITAGKLIYWMSQIPQFGAVRIRNIYESCGTVEELYNIEGTELQRRGIVRRTEAVLWDQARETRELVFRQFDTLEQRGIRFFTPLDPEYPSRLRNLPDYPMGLYVKGKLPDEGRPAVAIIGARACTPFGSQMAVRIAGTLAREDIQIISGLAAGIDGAGHCGALREQKDTYAVLGCGVNICYPKEHYRIYEDILKQGGILSEYPLGTEPRKQNFPLRNRLISGLSDVIVVVEARKQSGSLITVDLALEQGKAVFAMPGRINEPLSSGCNSLIQQGAYILNSPQDIIDYLGIKRKQMLKVPEEIKITLAKKEKIVYSCLDLDPKHMDEIVKLSDIAVGECMNILLSLEMEGHIIQTAGHYYMKKVQ